MDAAFAAPLILALAVFKFRGYHEKWEGFRTGSQEIA